ncbi:MAG TPA: iron-containing alcohol dehydrogenase [Candidatus Caccalectryoclostridium excrementigallinarum]|uniref:Iron-containing alcohol dehydrogenase n=1 Tax=Candidatus Caccalectryoclostridium excrementigallinarum TaxID=2840710 RepID=A0A9D1SK08_9FIRM|nr:iron-containing alcohol dehydrogenase [Candidatus Caccalectryoclostridium excrementigallinarum]
MNIFYKMYCRTFQAVLKQLIKLMPWRKPELLQFENGAAGLASFVKSKGIEKVLVVTDGNLMKLGLCAPMLEAMEKEGVKAAVYDKVVANPTIDNVEAALALYNESGAQGIIAFGGGSPMDCAKGVGARVARPKKSIPKMKGILKVVKKMPPFFAIPTTSGTGSETTLAAVITDTTNPEHHLKYAIQDFPLIPHYAVLDPSLTAGLPQKVTSTTGMDALCHAIEAYIGNSNTKETKQKAEEAIKLIFTYLKRAYDDGKDMEARKNMQTAAFDAGVAFTRAYVGNVHAMGHAMGAKYNTPHGLAMAVILPHMLDFYGEKIYKKLAKLADVVGITGAGEAEKAKAFIKAVKDMNAYMQIPENFGGIIKKEDAVDMSEAAYKEANPLYPVPVMMGKEDFVKMYLEVLNG